MAISWATEIIVLDVETQTVSVICTRTDDVEPSQKTYMVASAIIETAAQKLAVMDNIWAQHQAALTRESVINTFIGSLEADANANLEARE